MFTNTAVARTGTRGLMGRILSFSCWLQVLCLRWWSVEATTGVFPSRRVGFAFSQLEPSFPLRCVQPNILPTNAPVVVTRVPTVGGLLTNYLGTYSLVLHHPRISILVNFQHPARACVGCCGEFDKTLEQAFSHIEHRIARSLWLSTSSTYH